MSEKKYVIGLDYGSDSARAVIVEALTGEELGSAVKHYPRWMEGKYCVPARDQYRQHPQDYIDVMEYIIKESLAQAGPEVAKNVVGMSFDTTGSTRSEERRVGKECRSRWSPYEYKKKGAEM